MRQSKKTLTSISETKKNKLLMKSILLTLVLLSASIGFANAQSAYAGRYWVIGSWGTGDLAGYGSSGPATALRDGSVIITQFFGDGSSGQITAEISKKGYITLDAPDYGFARIFKSGKTRFASNICAVTWNGYSSSGIFTFSNAYLP
jgi:hypothetical protein